MHIMQKTMLALCEQIQGCVLGYTQSDEITLILIDYQRTEMMLEKLMSNRYEKVQ